MPITFGAHAPASEGAAYENGMYEATIRSMTIVSENGAPKVNDNGKQLCDVVFAMDADNTIRRRYPIGFGQNSANKQWSAFAKLIEAVTGVKCGDPAQREVSDDQMVGKPCRIVVEKNDRGYSDVSNVLASAAPQPAKAAPRPQPVPSGAVPANAPESEEIPF